MKKKKVLHILHCVGGVEVWLRLMLANIDPEKFENIVIHGENDTKEPFYYKDRSEVKRYRVPIFREIAIIKDSIAIYKSYKIIQSEKPDIIHVHSAKGGIIGRLIGRFFNIKVLFTPQAFSYLSETDGLKKNVFLQIEKTFANGNSILLASSNSERNRAIQEVGYEENKTLVFNNCVEPIAAIQPLSIPKTWPDNYICTVGRPCYQKNIDFMIKVFHEVKKSKDIHLVLMGVGHHVGQLDLVKQMIIDLDLSQHVTLLDWTSREDVLHIVSKSQLYLSTARYEGLPYAIIESLALSKACVVSDCDGNRDLVRDGYNGFLIKEYDVDAYKNKIITLLDDKALSDKFSENAQQLFLENFNIKTNITELESIYTAYSKA
jgi:glycosyltransferase involved in cell wall biosynthesis